MEIFQNLAIALALGLLIGTERGWHARAGAEGSRVAGIRTFALIGLLGALAALIARDTSWLVLPGLFIALAAALIVAHVQSASAGHDYGLTTVIAALVAFAVGALVMLGYPVPAAAAAVVTTLLLQLKPELHHWLEHLEARDLRAALKLLVISVVLLPLLPDRGFGPWQALNPYELWWLVVLIAGISFAGYAAVRVTGADRGLLLTGLFGGLVSSTAVTLNFARFVRDNAALRGLLAAGIVVAAVTMFPRMLIEVAVVNRALLPQVALPLAVMAVAGALAGWVLWRQRPRREKPAAMEFRNPLELTTAIQFATLLAAVTLAVHWLRAGFGDAGVYFIAAVSALGDVDAVTLSVARLAGDEGLAPEIAARAIVLAALVNTAVKGVLAAVLSRGALTREIGLAFAAVIAAGAAALLAG